MPYFDSHLQYTGGCEFYGAYVGDPLHRFYQMWQQTDGYHGKLFIWTANTAGDDNGAMPPEPDLPGRGADGLLQHGRGRRAHPA